MLKFFAAMLATLVFLTAVTADAQQRRRARPAGECRTGCGYPVTTMEKSQ